MFEVTGFETGPTHLFVRDVIGILKKPDNFQLIYCMQKDSKNPDRSFIIRVYGDSLVLPRIGTVTNAERYVSQIQTRISHLLGIHNITVIERAFASLPIEKISYFFRHDNAYFGERGDILIIHCGVVDCAPRPVPIWIREIISRTPHQPRRSRTPTVNTHNTIHQVINNGKP